MGPLYDFLDSFPQYGAILLSNMMLYLAPKSLSEKKRKEKKIRQEISLMQL